jgi:hypothetical protein
VNGHSCLTIDHYEAVGILKAAGSRLHIRVEREVHQGAHSSITNISTSNGHLASLKKVWDLLSKEYLLNIIDIRQK